MLPTPRRFAAIDIGSNALRMRVVETSGVGPSVLRASERAAVRLGRDVFGTGRLAPDTLDAAVAALRHFRDVLGEHRVESYRAVATSAVRDADNGADLVRRAAREADLRIEVIDGDEEARLVRRAVLAALPLAGRRALLVDIGGGSVELTVTDGELVRRSVSLPLGTVRLLERFLPLGGASDPLRHQRVRRHVAAVLHASGILDGGRPEVVVATGGNAEAVAALAPVRGDARAIDVARMRVVEAELSALEPRDRVARFDLRPDRADVIEPALALLGVVAREAGALSILAPGVGLVDGLVVEAREGDPATDEAAAVALGRDHHFDEAHALRVAHLAERLFDGLRHPLGLAAGDRRWLRLGALLHDVGDRVHAGGFADHHKQSYELIRRATGLGLDAADREVVANVARYHRKSLPDTDHPGFRRLDRARRRLVRRLAALLRIADALDRDHRGRVSDVSAHLAAGGRVQLSVRGEGDLAPSLWAASRRAQLLAELLGRTVGFEVWRDERRRRRQA